MVTREEKEVGVEGTKGIGNEEVLCPMSESPARREKVSKTMQLAKRESLLLTQARALCCIQLSGTGQRAPSPSCYTNL